MWLPRVKHSGQTTSPKWFWTVTFQVDGGVITHLGKKIFTQYCNRMPLLPQEMFLWHIKNAPKQKTTPPTNVFPIIKYRKKFLSLQHPYCPKYHLGGGEGVGWCRLHCTFLFDTFISGLPRDNAALDIAKARLTLYRCFPCQHC